MRVVCSRIDWFSVVMLWGAAGCVFLLFVMDRMECCWGRLKVERWASWLYGGSDVVPWLIRKLIRPFKNRKNSMTNDWECRIIQSELIHASVERSVDASDTYTMHSKGKEILHSTFISLTAEPMLKW